MARGEVGQTRTAKEALRAFIAPDLPEVISEVDGASNGYGRVTYRYRQIYVQLETEMGCAAADLATDPEFSATWPFDAVLAIVPGSGPDNMSSTELARLLTSQYDAIYELLSTKEGRERLDQSKERRDAEWRGKLDI